MNLSALVSYYIPSQFVIEKRKIMFNVLLGLLAQPHIDHSTKIPIVDNLFAFLSDLENLNLAKLWLENGVVFNNLETKAELFKLGTKHRYSILKKIFEEPSIPVPEKHELLAKVIGDDKSDIAENTKETCIALIPTAENKAHVWEQLTDTNSTESIYKRGAKMGGFYSWKQLDLIRPYFDKFYEVLPHIYEKSTFKYVENFYTLLPRMEIKDEHIVKLLALKLQTADNNTNFANLLNENLELVMRSKQVREYALKH